MKSFVKTIEKKLCIVVKSSCLVTVFVTWLSIMAKICDVCQKGKLKGNLVPRGIGRRVTNRSIRFQTPNLQNKKVTIDGVTQRLKICTSCIKRMKFETKKKAESKTA